jgi:HTH-type transcriptional regulator, cell division transcriptional repressor
MEHYESCNQLKFILMAERNIIGKRVKLARRNSKPPITQSDLAARLQIQGLKFERITVTKIETGYREVTDIEVKAIANALDVTIGWLYCEDD